MFSLLRTVPLVIACVCVVSGGLRAQEPVASAGNGTVNADANGTTPAQELPSAGSIQAQIDSVDADQTLAETLKTRLLSTLRGTTDALRTLQSDRDREQTLITAAQTAPGRLIATREALAAETPQAQLPADATDPQNPLSLEALRQRRSEADVALNAVRQERQGLEDEQRERLARVLNLTMAIAEARTALEQSVATAVGEVEDDPQGSLRSARQNQRLVNIAVARQRLATLLAEQAMIEAESELLPLQIERAVRKTTYAEAMLRLWTDLLGAQKQFRIESDVADFGAKLEQAGIEIGDSKAWPLTNRWIEVVSSNALTRRSLADQQSRFDDLDARFKEVTTEIERDLASNEGLRSGLGLKLLRIRSRLPSSSRLRAEIREVDDELEQTRQLQTEIDSALDDINDSLVGYLVEYDSEESEERRSARELETSLLRRMKSDTDEHINDLIELKGLIELKRRKAVGLRDIIEKNVIWIRDATAFRPRNLPNAWQALQRIFYSGTFQSSFRSVVDTVPLRIDLGIIWILGAVVPWAFGQRLRKRLDLLNRSAPIPTQRPLFITLVALFLSLLLSIPAVVTMAVIGTLISDAPDQLPMAVELGQAFQIAAILVLPMLWLRHLLRPNGIAESHFRFDRQQTQPARTALGLTVVLGVPLILLWVMAASEAVSQGEFTLARSVFVISMMLLAMVLWRAFDPKTGIEAKFLNENPDGWLAKLRFFWHGMTLLPLALVALTLTGYTYAAVLLSTRMYWSLWFVIVLMIISGLLKRWVQVRRALPPPTRPGDTNSLSIPEPSASGAITAYPVVNTDEITKSALAETDAQTLRLLNALLWVAVLIGVAWLWAPVLPAVRFLERVALWDTAGIDGAVVTITLANLVIAIPIAFLTWVSARNVPGLVETTLLERLPLDKPARYAITSLASYAIVIIGIMFTSRTIGLRWEGIQWLVAALGVGLGFGLQEIFANFVSGLILLFEQPIRVGDVVTIGDTTGSVSKIRMRATIVTNWDRQELIIPNKTLITERLINWTLSDSTNRLEIPIGVAYGTDTRIACRILEEICNQHEHILVDPKPIITFQGFGDSTLNIIARFFLGRLDLRLQTLHELNTTINERFAAAGIEIAFPQQDIHIRSIPPDWHVGSTQPLAKTETDTPEK